MRVWLPFILALSLVGFAVAPVGSSAAVLRGSISYSKSGGIAGIEESMKIDRNARGKIARRTFKLPRREGRRLATAIRRADLADVKSPKEPTCCENTLSMPRDMFLPIDLAVSRGLCGSGSRMI